MTSYFVAVRWAANDGLELDGPFDDLEYTRLFAKEREELGGEVFVLVPYDELPRCSVAGTLGCDYDGPADVHPLDPEQRRCPGCQEPEVAR